MQAERATIDDVKKKLSAPPPKKKVSAADLKRKREDEELEQKILQKELEARRKKDKLEKVAEEFREDDDAIVAPATKKQKIEHDDADEDVMKAMGFAGFGTTKKK